MKKLMKGLLILLWLFAGSSVWACPGCRGQVKASIYRPDYPFNLLMLLLPVIILLLTGLSLYYAGSIQSTLQRSIHQWLNTHNASP